MEVARLNLVILCLIIIIKNTLIDNRSFFIFNVGHDWIHHDEFLHKNNPKPITAQ